MSQLKFTVLLLLILSAPMAVAQQSNTPQMEQDPLVMLGDEYQNSIKLLQNRFRIDYKVDELTMVFFRKFGSAPIVLVRPDGSKIYRDDAFDDKNIEWFDSTSYDMIKLKNPMPGPWQAMGPILPGSRVMVISDIELHADPLPDVLFSGEILKQTAYLTNGGEPIDYAEFRDVVKLDIVFASTNNPNYDNFGAQSSVVASFDDNGKGMDEVPQDGVFTGQFNLKLGAGEWRPVFEVKTPMFTREQFGKPLMLQPNPISISVKPNDPIKGNGYHQVIVDSERTYVDMNSLLVDGKVRFPNGDVQGFSLTNASDQARIHNIVAYEYGIFRVKLTVYGNTKSGRDFILDVPEYTFLAEQPAADGTIQSSTGIPSDQLPANVTPGELAAQRELERLQSGPDIDEEPLPMVTQEPELDESLMTFIIIGINLGILLLGGIVIWFMMTRGNPKSEQTEPEPGLWAKMMTRFKLSKKEKAPEKKETAEEKPTVDANELSMPE